MQLQQAPAPGARALIRDEEWIVQNADVCQLGGWQLSCIGISVPPGGSEGTERPLGGPRTE